MQAEHGDAVAGGSRQQRLSPRIAPGQVHHIMGNPLAMAAAQLQHQ